MHKYFQKKQKLNFHREFIKKHLQKINITLSELLP